MEALVSDITLEILREFGTVTTSKGNIILESCLDNNSCIKLSLESGKLTTSLVLVDKYTKVISTTISTTDAVDLMMLSKLFKYSLQEWMEIELKEAKEVRRILKEIAKKLEVATWQSS